MKKCELYIMTASMLNIVAHGEVSQLVVMAANSLLNGKVAPAAIGWIAVSSPSAIFIFIFKCRIKKNIHQSFFVLCFVLQAHDDDVYHVKHPARISSLMPVLHVTS